MATSAQPRARRVNHNSSAAVINRLEALEVYARTHGESITALTGTAVEQEKRIARLEELAQSRAITEAREDERDKALYRRLDLMDAEIAALRTETRKEFGAIKGVAARALGIFFGALILAVVAFLVSGGFAPR